VGMLLLHVVLCTVLFFGILQQSIFLPVKQGGAYGLLF